jgi:hypothetical protein
MMTQEIDCKAGGSPPANAHYTSTHTQPLKMHFLVDDNGGVERFPKGASIYAITFAPDDRDLKYVGATLHTRRRLQTHFKIESVIQPWQKRLAYRLYLEECFEPADWAAQDRHAFEMSWLFPSFVSYTRTNSDAELLQTFDASCSRYDIGTAENKWIAELQPELNCPRWSVGGYY